MCGDASAYAAENIFNVVKEADIVTHVPLAQWGYSRAGTDIVLPSQQALVERAEDALATMGEIVPDIESYYKDRHSLTRLGCPEDGMTAFEMMLLVASSLAEADESMAVKETPVLESVAPGERLLSARPAFGQGKRGSCCAARALAAGLFAGAYSAERTRIKEIGTMAYIEFRDVCKVYSMGQHEIHALDHISFTIEKGELCVIVGPSGAGKTTAFEHPGRHGYRQPPA